MAVIYVLQGRANCGKTSTIKMLCAKLINKYKPSPDVIRISEDTSKDITFVLKNVKGHTIGIESEGDEVEHMENSFNTFKNKKCDIIFCASRTRGQTVECINSLKRKYKIHRVSQTKILRGKARQDESNNNMAKKLISMAGL